MRREFHHPIASQNSLLGVRHQEVFFLRRDDKWAVIFLLQVLVVYTVRWLSGGVAALEMTNHVFLCVCVYKKEKKNQKRQTCLCLDA